MTAFRTLMVGFGDIASGLDQDLKMARYFEYASHASVLSAHPAFDWLGTVDLREAALINARDKWRIPVVETDLATAIEKVRPEIAVLATPPGQRAEAVAAMPDLKAVLVEKPLSGPNDNDGKALATICAERGIPVLVNYWRRADRNFRDLAAGGLKARIGAPQAVFGLYGKGLANNCSHMIDFLRMLLGDVTTVQALGPAVPSPDSTVPGDLQLPFALTLEDSTVASFGTVDFHHYREVGLDIWGERGRLSVLLEGLSATFFRNGSALVVPGLRLDQRKNQGTDFAFGRRGRCASAGGLTSCPMRHSPPPRWKFWFTWRIRARPTWSWDWTAHYEPKAPNCPSTPQARL